MKQAGVGAAAAVGARGVCMGAPGGGGMPGVGERSNVFEHALHVAHMLAVEVCYDTNGMRQCTPNSINGG